MHSSGYLAVAFLRSIHAARLYGSGHTLLRKSIQQLFENQNYIGSAVIIDVATAGVLAMASTPTYDLNTYYLSKN